MKTTTYFIIFSSILAIYGGTMQQSAGCVLQKVAGYLNRFTVLLSTTGEKKTFWCANGTVFDQETCACVLSTDPNAVFTAPPPTEPSYPTDASGQVIRTTTERGCDFKPDVDRTYYQQYISGAWMRRLCPMGTLYNEEMCLCVDMAPISSALCRPQVHLDFNKKPIQNRGGTIFIYNKEVDSVEGAGRFNRRGRLAIPLYAGGDFGNKLTITFRFYDFPGGDDEQVLVANCDTTDKQFGSIEIIMSPRNQEVIFRIDTVRSPPREISVPYPLNSWKNVTMTYDGNVMRGIVNTEENSVMAKGKIAGRTGNLSIGQCPIGNSMRAFVGYIDDFKVHKCVKNGGYFGSGGFIAGNPV